MSAPANRPHVTVVMAMTADGKITSAARESVRLAGPRDRELLDRLRADADAVLHGGTTIRVDDPPMRIRSEERIRARVAAGRPPHPLQVVVSRTLALPFEGRFFNEPDVERLVVTGPSPAEDRVRAASAHAGVVRARGEDATAEEILRILEAHGARRVLSEGGGALNFILFAAGAVDEIYVTIAPWILGGGRAPTPVDGAGLPWSERVALEIAEMEREGNEIYVRYRVRGASS